MKNLKIFIGIVFAVFILTLIFMLFDASVSLDNSRSQNTSLTERCELLSILASQGLHGQNVNALITKFEPDYIVKRDGSQLLIDDVVLQIENDKVLEIARVDSCQ